MASATAPHLNNTGCMIRRTNDKGRGVYASRSIPAQTLIEISPVLFFSKEEYAKHGKFTVLDDYTFKWADGRMALALGLGSLFNHSERPNVSYALDTYTESIKYTTVRDIAPDEELCIFYGHNLWFRPAGTSEKVAALPESDAEDGWGGFSAVGECADPSPFQQSPFEKGDPDEVIPEEELPFTRYKPPPEEEDLDSIRTVEAWVVDVPNPRHITKMLKWLRQAGLETPDLGHLKRIRKIDDTATLLLATLVQSPTSPSPPSGLDLPPPYVTLVPSAPALTPISLKLKSTFWPTLFTPSRKGEAEEWTRGQAHWAWQAMKTTVIAAHDARSRGEMPIAAHVAAPYETGTTGVSPDRSFTGWDTRQSSAHPLRHAVINVVRKMADYQASSSTPARTETPFGLISSASSGPAMTMSGDAEEPRNGANYLLTSLTMFTTHEPCIMCSMALIHSRVKEIVYLRKMPRTGGCGGATCLPTLKGVNHRFGIAHWKEDLNFGEDLHVDDTLDA
ncbi:SET domain-containing protein 7 [Termitomyces sp. J132]|nr:hypothetical protein H2248_007543 [Termitomyces sp. 'cryptogamus']KNZ80969.1 SET domain-containing protein 7 [Termitomyces sp. J132]